MASNDKLYERKHTHCTNLLENAYMVLQCRKEWNGEAKMVSLTELYSNAREDYLFNHECRGYVGEDKHTTLTRDFVKRVESKGSIKTETSRGEVMLKWN